MWNLQIQDADVPSPVDLHMEGMGTEKVTFFRFCSKFGSASVR